MRGRGEGKEVRESERKGGGGGGGEEGGIALTHYVLTSVY